MTTVAFAIPRQTKWLLYGAALLMGAALFLVNPGDAYADVPGDFKFTITSEGGGGALASARIHIACTGGTITGIGTTSATGTLFAAPAAGSSCANTDAIIGYAVEREGMVTYTTLPPNIYTAGDLNAVTTTNIRFQVKVLPTDQEGTAFTPGDLDVFTLGGSAASTSLGSASFFGRIGTSVTLLVQENGYVSASTTNPGLTDITTASTSQILITFASSTSVGAAITSTSTVRGLVFSHIVKTQREGDSDPLAGAAVSAGGITCNEESSNTGTYFCPVLVAGDGGTNDIHIALDGYVKDVTGSTPNRDGDAASAATTTVSSIYFSHRINILNAVIGSSVTPDHASAGANDVTCDIVSNAAYCPVLLADDNGSEGFGMQADGYVSTTAALASNRAASNTAQGVVTLTTTTGLPYGGVVTLLGNSNNKVTGAAVKAGDGYGTTCTESGTSGVYYCAVPVADTSRSVQFVKSSYTTRSDVFASDRTASTTAQQTLTYNQFHADASGGGGTPTLSKPVITAITLGDGSGTTGSLDITITISGSNILRYKIATSQAGLTSADYPQYPGTAIAYTLSGADGVKTLWFQFMSSDGGESTATSKQITYKKGAVPATPATPATPAPAAPAEPATPAALPKVSVPVVLLIDLPRVPTVITLISAKPKAPDFTPVSIAALAEGDLFMIEDASVGASVYWFTGGYKRPFSSEKAFMSWFPSFDRVSIKRVKKDEISYLAWGPSMPYKPGSRMIKVPDDSKVYNIQVDGTVCHVKDEKDAAKLFGKKWNKSVDDMSVSQFLGTYKLKDACVVA